MRRRFSLLIPVAASLLIFFGMSPLPAQDESDEKDAKKNATHKVKAGPLRVRVNLKGTFEASNSVGIALRPKAGSKLEVKNVVPHGTRVKKGEKILVLDPESMDRAIENAEFGARLSDLSLALAKLELKLLEKSTPLDLAAAERSKAIADETRDYFLNTSLDRQKKSTLFSLDSAKHRLEYAQEELKQLRQMYKADDLTEETEEIILKRAERSVKSAEFSLESQQLRTTRTLEVELPREEKSVRDAADRAAISLERSKLSLPTDLEKARIGFEKLIYEHEQTRRKLEELKHDRGLVEVLAPINGYVYYGSWTNGKWSGKSAVESSLKPGGTIAPKQVVMTVVSLDVARIRTTVSEKDLADIRPELAGTAEPTAFPTAKLPAKVASVSLIPSSSGSFDAVLSVAAPPRIPVVAGMACSVELKVYDKEKAITVPASAVFDDDGEADHEYVFVVTDKGHSKRPVKTGRSKGDNTEIVDGLKDGEEILLSRPESE